MARLAARLFGLLAVLLLTANPVLANVCGATCANGPVAAPMAQAAPQATAADAGGCPEHAAMHHAAAPAPVSQGDGTAVQGTHLFCCGGAEVTVSSEAASRAEVTPGAVVTAVLHAPVPAVLTVSWRPADAPSPPLRSPHPPTVLRI